ncbi:MAG: FtsX-like permease family protein [Alphaproteobacteria bacterium]|nr:FtsX-like permease family protein [Alphaproteobacteria bacterium]
MLHWTLKSLVARPVYLLASACGVAFALMLVIFIEAVFAGESGRIVAYLQKTKGDVWVMQRGVSNMHMATSFISDWKVAKIAKIEGVRKATPILYMNASIEIGGRQWFSFVVGMAEGDDRAGPWHVVRGKRRPGKGEVIIPATLARITGLDLGATITLNTKKLKVVGLSGGTFSMANSVTFAHADDLSDVMSAFGMVSYVLVDAETGVDPRTLAARIREQIDKVNAVPLRDFIASDYAMAMQMGVEIIDIMSIIGVGLAIVITGFTVYSQTSRRRRELAVAKALGVRNRAVYGSVLLQAVCIALLGLAIATALAYTGAPLIEALVPLVALTIEPEVPLKLGVLALVIAAIASLIPARQVLRLDPAMAFHS